MKAQLARWSVVLKRGLNLWLLLGTFFSAGAVLVAVNAVLMFDLLRGHIGQICAAARNTYNQGGPEALRLVLYGVETGSGLRIHLIDSAGRDLTTSQYWIAPVSPAQPFPLPIPGRKPPAIIERNETYSCVAEPRARPSFPFGPMLWVLPFVSVLCCSIGAYVTWRMRKIEAVVNHFGKGGLAVRLTSSSGDAFGRLAQALNRMADRIEAVVASHQRLCTDMAHELRSPLTRLLLAVPKARRGVAAAMDRIEREASRMNQLVDELLEVARTEVCDEALQPELVDVDSLLTEIADHCGLEAAERNCEIEIINLSRAGSITGDRELLWRAVENVVRNAIQHAPQHSKIHLTGRGDLDSVTIGVRDFGPGVPEVALTEIFKPFYRVKAARDRDTGGGGLGLAIAQRAIGLHQGTIRAENCEPGLRVTISLPRN